MKNIFLGLLVVIMFSCMDENGKKLLLPDNTFWAKKNNAGWTGVLEISGKTNTDTLTFFASANMPDTEVLVMKIKFEGPGTYELKGNRAHYYSTVGGDAIVSEYMLAPNTSGTLNILKYNQRTEVMKGNFEIKLIKAWSNPENNIDALHFTTGTFEGAIQWQK